MLDFIRIACAVPDVSVGDVEKNAETICSYLAQADEKKVDLLLFPELCLTGASCGDLFFDDALHTAVTSGVKKIVEASQAHPGVTLVIGLPWKVGIRRLNCAMVISGGEILGMAEKKHLTVE